MSAGPEFIVYVLRCWDGSHYVGSTTDLPERILTHNAGKGAAWTARRRPVRLVYQEACCSQDDAVRRERQIKRWSRAKKVALIAGDIARIRQLSKRRT